MKKVRNLFAIIMALAVMMVSTIPAFADSENKAVMDARNGVLEIEMWFSDPEAGIETSTFAGSGFLINEDTVITCQHLVTSFDKSFFANWAHYITSQYGVKRSAEQVQKLSEIRVSVYRDVYVKATIKKVSEEMDYAILKLEEPIQGKTALPIRDSDTVKQTEEAFALGFPGDMKAVSEQNYYDTEDVTVTSGKVDKVGRMGFTAWTIIIDGEGNYDYKERAYNNVDCVESSAYLAGGNSGGPLVDAAGNVIGINAAGDGTRNFAVSSKQLTNVLKALGITYTEAGAPVVTTQAPAESTTNADKSTTTSKPEPNGKKLSTGAIVGIAAAVAAVVIIAIIIILVSKKNSAPAPSNGPSPAGGFTPPAPTPDSKTATGAGAEGSEGTTVLSGNASDPNATTVLGASAASAYLLRTSNNEKIYITKSYFKIGKDANRVDYCITGNPAVSRFHASIVSKNGQYFIVDNSTTNHTYVNDSMIPANVETQISNGAKIRLADEKFEFKI